MDCLFLHVPKLLNYYRPIHHFIWINFMPMGLLALDNLSGRRVFRKRKISGFPLPVGRGCPVQCTWCGGSITQQETISGRRDPVFRGVEEVLQSIKEAISYGYETFHISFDPYPQKPEYYLRLFSRIREEKLRMECYFESFGLPTIDFIKAFKETFPRLGSRIALSPDTGSSRVRKGLKRDCRKSNVATSALCSAMPKNLQAPSGEEGFATYPTWLGR